MQRAECAETTGVLFPLKGFVVVLVLLLAGGLLLYFAKDSDEPKTTGNQAPPISNNFALTDTEALARFYELKKLDSRLFRERDLSLISVTYTADGSAGERARHY